MVPVQYGTRRKLTLRMKCEHYIYNTTALHNLRSDNIGCNNHASIHLVGQSER
jgi:hypothetical protein